MEVNFEIATTRIKVGKDGYFDVRGVNTDDMTFLTVEYLDDIKAFIAQGGKKAMTGDRVAELIMKLAKEFSGLTSEIISRCAEAPDRVDDFRRLPFPVALAALKAIFDLSMIDGGVELGNLARAVAALLEVNGLKLGSVATQLNDIIASAEKTSTS